MHARLLATVTLAAALLFPPLPRSVAQEARPNVLVIVTDDQREGTLWAMPETRRWFVQRGIRFPHAYVTTPLCCPSRSSIFTGRYAHNHGVTNNGQATVLDQESTVQRYLEEAGYTTAIIGKFLNLWDVEVPPPHFDLWATFSPPLYGPGYEDAVFNVNGQLATVDYSTDFIRKKAVQFLHGFEESDAAPWFLYVAPWAPHSPFHPADEYRRAPVPAWDGNPATQEQDLSDKPPWIQDDGADLAKGQAFRRKQGRTLMSVDDMVSQVMSALGTLGERGNTLVIFLSDNGFLWGEHGYTTKRVPYPQSIEVPFFMRWPGHLEPGTRDPRPVANVDIAPTILEAAGIRPDPRYPIDGWSLLGPHERDHRFLEYWTEPGAVPDWASVRSTTLQYVEYYDGADQVIFREYYDLLSDPWQLENLLGDGDPSNDPSPGQLADLKAQLQHDRRCAGTEGPGACP